MEELNKIVGQNLLALRRQAKITQLELAEKFSYSDKSISKWETGESLPSLDTLYELSKFYGVTIDDLLKEDFIVPTPDELKNKAKDRTLPTKLSITLLAVSAVWFCATVLFVSFKITYDINYGLFFIWAIPVSCIVLIVFNSIWGKRHFLFPILSIMIWSTLLSTHLTFISYNIWIIYILGVPLQVAVILWSTLGKSKR